MRNIESEQNPDPKIEVNLSKNPRAVDKKDLSELLKMQILKMQSKKFNNEVPGEDPNNKVNKIVAAARQMAQKDLSDDTKTPSATPSNHNLSKQDKGRL